MQFLCTTLSQRQVETRSSTVDHDLSVDDLTARDAKLSRAKKQLLIVTPPRKRDGEVLEGLRYDCTPCHPEDLKKHKKKQSAGVTKGTKAH